MTPLQWYLLHSGRGEPPNRPAAKGTTSLSDLTGAYSVADTIANPFGMGWGFSNPGIPGLLALGAREFVIEPAIDKALGEDRAIYGLGLGNPAKAAGQDYTNRNQGPISPGERERRDQAARAAAAASRQAAGLRPAGHPGGQRGGGSGAFGGQRGGFDRGNRSGFGGGY